MKHLNKKRPPVNQEVSEMVSHNVSVPMEMDIVEVKEEVAMSDHALFGDEAVERDLHIHRPIVPRLQQPTTLPTTPSNTGSQHHLLNQFPMINQNL